MVRLMKCVNLVFWCLMSHSGICAPKKKKKKKKKFPADAFPADGDDDEPIRCDDPVWRLQQSALYMKLHNMHLDANAPPVPRSLRGGTPVDVNPLDLGDNFQQWGQTHGVAGSPPCAEGRR